MALKRVLLLYKVHVCMLFWKTYWLCSVSLIMSVIFVALWDFCSHMRTLQTATLHMRFCHVQMRCKNAIEYIVQRHAHLATCALGRGRLIKLEELELKWAMVSWECVFFPIYMRSDSYTLSKSVILKTQNTFHNPILKIVIKRWKKYIKYFMHPCIWCIDILSTTPYA